MISQDIFSIQKGKFSFFSNFKFYFDGNFVLSVLQEARTGSKVMRKSKSWKKLHVVFANSTTPISILKIGSNFLLVGLKSLR